MKCLKSDRNSMELAAGLLRRGEVLVLPTDTVYGFSGIVGKTDEKIRKIKGRDEGKPFIVLVDSIEKARAMSFDHIPDELAAFWPGPLTVIVRRIENPLSTVAVRCPGDEWLRNVIREAGSPVYSTSVNRSGCAVLSRESEILSEFEDEVSLVVLDGDSKNSVPSTIVSLSADGYRVVREGVLKIS